MGMLAARPRVLHLYGDWQWTGPAEPVVHLCRRLRREGYAVDLACPRALGDYPRSIEHRARERRVEPVLDFEFGGPRNPMSVLRDVRRLTEYLDREEVQIVHVHTALDHYLGSRAARRANNQPRVVRTNHTGRPLPPTLLNRWIVAGHTHGWTALSPACLADDTRRFRIPPHYGVVMEGIVDSEQYDPQTSRRDVRAGLGIAAHATVLGVVAPPDALRRWRLLLPMLAEVEQRTDGLRVLLLGGAFGPELRALCAALPNGGPLAPEYRDDDAPDYLACADVVLAFRAENDGACPGAREAMLLGKPLIVTRDGLLPDLLQDERCGIVSDDTPDALVEAILRLACAPELRRKLGRVAAAHAAEAFRLDRQAAVLGELYLRLAEGL